MASISLPRSRSDQRGDIANATVAKTYGKGEAIVRQGEPGESMYVLCSGTVAVVLEPDKREVATIRPGGYFGEMSLLTGEPRSATVVARGEVVVLELTAEVFRHLGAGSPHAIEQVGSPGDYAAGRARPREVFREGHGRRRGPRVIPRADEEIPAPVLSQPR
jgi:CRP-like cAMP-binding protein